MYSVVDKLLNGSICFKGCQGGQLYFVLGGVQFHWRKRKPPLRRSIGLKKLLALATDATVGHLSSCWALVLVLLLQCKLIALGVHRLKNNWSSKNYTTSQKTSTFYFSITQSRVNRILIVFGKQNPEEISHRWLWTCPPPVKCHRCTLWNAELMRLTEVTSFCWKIEWLLNSQLFRHNVAN